MYFEQHKLCCLIAKVEDVKENAIIIIVIIINIVKCQFFLGGWQSGGVGGENKGNVYIM